MKNKTDIITPQQALTIPGLFNERLKRSNDSVAYTWFNESNQQWTSYSWAEINAEIQRWQNAFASENLQAGDRVAIMLNNSPNWVCFDQAALRSGLVLVPLYTNDRADNIGFIVEDAGIKLLLIDNDSQWQTLKTAYQQLDGLQRIISVHPIENANDERVINLQDWLKLSGEIVAMQPQADDLATIVYTSGTTGRPKGVMLSHRNIVWNAHAGSRCINIYPEDTFLSFLPLSHMFERSIGYYLPIVTGSRVAFARSIEALGEDLITIKPTVFITVPRIFERVYNKIQTQLSAKPPIAKKLFDAAVNVGWHRFLKKQHRASWHPKLLLWPLLNTLVAKKIMKKLGGNLRLAVSGGAPLSNEIAKTFIGLGLTISQGYGLTETSPVISTNRIDDNDPFTVGQPLPDVEIRLGDNDELQIRSPGIMLGYWKNEQATKDTIDDDGWLHSGDKASIVDNKISITGRLKEIIVMSNGEKVPPADLELAIANNALFEQVLIVGEAKPFLSAIVVLNPDKVKLLTIAGEENIDISQSLENKELQEKLLNPIKEQLKSFPGYAKIYKVYATLEPWAVENGLITPTLKLKRNKLHEKFRAEIDAIYKGH